MEIISTSTHRKYIFFQMRGMHSIYNYDKVIFTEVYLLQPKLYAIVVVTDFYMTLNHISMGKSRFL